MGVSDLVSKDTLERNKCKKNLLRQLNVNLKELLKFHIDTNVRKIQVDNLYSIQLTLK